MASSTHLPVLLEEVLTVLRPRSGGMYIDGTLGAGGHSAAILAAAAPDGRLLGLDQDPTMLAVAQARLAPFGPNATTVRANFREITAVARETGFLDVDGILLDLGFSSIQMDNPSRGFSFLADAPLDMRLDPEGDSSAADLVNTLPEQELADLIYTYGEERHARKIARAIVTHRPITRAKELGTLIERVVPRRRGERIHPATRTFQALRIAVNDELGVLEAVLPQAVALLRPGGRLAVISFHSLEDRIVKNFFRQESTDCLCPPAVLVCQCGHRASLAPVLYTADQGGASPHQAEGPKGSRRKGEKLITPTAAEIEANPRARSAKLRAAEKIESQAIHGAL